MYNDTYVLVYKTCTVYIIRRHTLCVVQCTVCRTVYSVCRTVYSVCRTVYSVCCTVYSVCCTVYSVHIVHFTCVVPKISAMYDGVQEVFSIKL